MKLIGLLLLAAVIAAAVVTVYLIGVAVGRARQYTAELRFLGIDRHTVNLYRDAIRLLYRLDGTADLGGIAAGDVLSPETREQVTAWVARHRKENNRT